MRRPFVLCALFVWSLLLLGETCGTEIGNKSEGEPCTRRSECRDGLECKAGICTMPRDAGSLDGGEPELDASADGG